MIHRLPETLQAVAPLVGVAVALALVLLGAPRESLLQLAVGATLVTLGMLLLLVGVDFGLLPMGRFIGAALPKRGSLGLILGVAFALGFAVTAAEPDVLVLSEQVAATSQGALGGWGLVYVIAAGVGLFTAVAVLRVVRGFSLRALLTAVYAVVIALSLVAPEQLVPVAFDAGSVTTGVLTAPVVLALALGVSSVLAGRSAADGFGLLGLASVGPIVVLLLLGLVSG